MNTPRSWAGGLAAAFLLLAFAGATAAETPKKKGFFNRLRGGEPKQEETAAVPTSAPAEAQVPPSVTASGATTPAPAGTAPAAAPAAATPAPAAAAPAAAAAATPAAVPVAAYDVKKLQDSMDKIQRSILGNEASVKAYLDLIGKGQATSTQLNDFAKPCHGLKKN